MKKRVSILLVIIWMIFIFIMSSFDADTSSNQSGLIVNIISNILNVSDIDLITFIIRKLAHFMEYFILGILICNSVYIYNKKNIYGIIICSIYAFSDEIHQIFVPGRSFQIRDIIIDILGSMVGIIIFYLYKQKFDKLK